MTGTTFRQTHGDPAQWTDDEYEQFAECATPGDPEPARKVLARLKAERAKDTDPTDLTTAV